jgi:hypothetical protein
MMKNLLGVATVLLAVAMRAEAAKYGTVMADTNTGAVTWPTNFIMGNSLVQQAAFGYVSNMSVFASNAAYYASNNLVSVEGISNIAVWASNGVVNVSNMLDLVNGDVVTNMIGDVLKTGTVFYAWSADDSRLLDGMTRYALTNEFLPLSAVSTSSVGYASNSFSAIRLDDTVTASRAARLYAEENSALEWVLQSDG